MTQDQRNNTGRPQEPPGELPKRAGRTHPPSLLKLTERLVRDENLLTRGELVICACSGGPDSTALLHVLSLLRSRIGHRVAAIGVEHGLRPEASSELKLAEELAAAQNVPFHTVRVHVPRGSNLQARARAARLAALYEGAFELGARAVATGHTADDRAETFLLRLLRGSGPRGLAVLPPRAPFPSFAEDRTITDGPPYEPENRAGDSTSNTVLPATETSRTRAQVLLIRPLLRARRLDIVAHLNRHGVNFAEDPSNRDPRFARVRVRRELLPLLEELSPKIVEHLGALADMLSGGGESSFSGLGLGRAQRQAIGRAQRLERKSLELLLEGGKEVSVTFPDGQIVLTQKKAIRKPI